MIIVAPFRSSAGEGAERLLYATSPPFAMGMATSQSRPKSSKSGERPRAGRSESACKSSEADETGRSAKGPGLSLPQWRKLRRVNLQASPKGRIYNDTRRILRKPLDKDLEPAYVVIDAVDIGWLAIVSCHTTNTVP